MSQATVPFLHPLVGCVRAVSRALDRVTDVHPGYLPTADKADLLEELSTQIARLEGLRLALLAVADDVAERDGARSAGLWTAHCSRLDPREGRRLQRLAEALDGRYAAVEASLRGGTISRAQAEVIVHALESLPSGVGSQVRECAERRLVSDAAEFTPGELRVIGRRVLEVVAPEVADDQERRALERDERRARRRMSIMTRDLGDGMSRAVVDLPTLSMHLWLTQLHAFASPRRDHLGAVNGVELPRTDPESGERIGHPQRLAQAFCTMLERMPKGVLPAHGGDATTLLVTIDHDDLVRGVGAARLSTGGRLSIGETRRLACNAGIIPVVLGGPSQPLDVGRKRRFYQPGQRKAMAVRDRECRAAGCDIPAAWCEAHHLKPWAEDGKTDLADGLLLCGFHHHRAHDRRYDLTRLASGDVRFHRRR